MRRGAKVEETPKVEVEKGAKVDEELEVEGAEIIGEKSMLVSGEELIVRVLKRLLEIVDKESMVVRGLELIGLREDMGNIED